MEVLSWLLDSDPAIRWQVLRDLTDAPMEETRTVRARVATEGWGARLLALQGEDGQWGGGTYFPSQVEDSEEGQPWTATTYSLLLLRDLGLDPGSDEARGAIARVGESSRWEEGDQPFFAGEVEPCINGMAVALGAYFGANVEAVVARLLSEQLDDGGELRGGKGLNALVVRDNHQRARRAARARARDRRVSALGRGSASWRGVPARARALPAQDHRRPHQQGMAAVLIPDTLAL